MDGTSGGQRGGVGRVGGARLRRVGAGGVDALAVVTWVCALGLVVSVGFLGWTVARPLVGGEGVAGEGVGGVAWG